MIVLMSNEVILYEKYYINRSCLPCKNGNTTLGFPNLAQPGTGSLCRLMLSPNFSFCFKQKKTKVGAKH